VDIGIVGAGKIGGNAARRLVLGGHRVALSFARDRAHLEALAHAIGPAARVGSPAHAAACPVVVVSVPWGAIDEALEQTGDLSGRIVIDTTNQFGPGGIVTWPGGVTAAQHNAARMAGARYTKTFNTLTAQFQAESAGRSGPDRVVQWVCGDDDEAKRIVMGLVDDAGYQPVDIGGLATCSPMEAPRRAGAVYGEEYHLAEAEAVVAALRAGRPIPPTPSYDSE
jgi:predicted dinucleotide-binding enzyme